MIGKFERVMVDWLIHEEVIEIEDRDLYEYAVRSLLISMSPLLLAIFVGIMIGGLKQSVVLIIPFMVIRKFAGGYHTKHLLSCLISSSILLFSCIMLSDYVTYGMELTVITVCSVIGLICCSPIDHENRKLDSAERSRYKIITTIIAIFFMVISIVFYRLGQHIYAVCISIGIILTFGLQLPCIIVAVLAENKKSRF